MAISKTLTRLFCVLTPVALLAAGCASSDNEYTRPDDDYRPKQQRRYYSQPAPERVCTPSDEYIIEFGYGENPMVEGSSAGTCHGYIPSRGKRGGKWDPEFTTPVPEDKCNRLDLEGYGYNFKRYQKPPVCR